MQEKACFSVAAPASPDTSVKGKHRKHVTHGYHLVEGKSNHAMEDCLVAELKQLDDNELGLFAIYDGHMGHNVAQYLQTHLFPNILKQVILLSNLSLSFKTRLLIFPLNFSLIYFLILTCLFLWMCSMTFGLIQRVL